MPLFRKKPVTVTAAQWFPGRYVTGVCICSSDECGRAPHVHTAHQQQAVRLQPGDWVIAEPNGDGHYPCKPDVFAATYQSAEGEKPVADKLDFQTGHKLIPALIEALNLGDTRLYSRVVLVLDCNDVPKLYATKVVDADAVLKVVETLKGAEVVADEDATEVIELTSARG